jgi:hypothetical protein
MTTDANLMAAAQTFAHLQWPLSAAAVRPTFIAQTIEYIADWAVRVAEHDPSFNPTSDQTVTRSFFVAMDEAQMFDELPADGDTLYATEQGHNIQSDVAGSWLFAVARHMVAATGAEVLTVWGRAWMKATGSWSDSVPRAIADDRGDALGLFLTCEQMQESVINEVGRMTLAQIAVVDDGGAGRRLAAVRERQRLARAAAAERETDARKFYGEWFGAFYGAVGVGQRKLYATDIPAVELAVFRLGWEQEQRWLFSEGADDGSFSRTVERWFGRVELV